MPAQHFGPLPARLIALIVIASTAIGSAAACGSGGPPGAGPKPGSAASSGAPDPAADAAGKAALAAYTGYLAAARKAEQAADPQHPELRKYLADPLLTRVRLTIRDAKEHGAMRTGTLISDPTVTAVNLDTVPQTVSIQDCVDSTGYRLVYVRNPKKEVPGSAGGRYLSTATATRYADGRWLISAGTTHRDQPC